jgi:hypothetical protein
VVEYLRHILVQGVTEFRSMRPSSRHTLQHHSSARPYILASNSTIAVLGRTYLHLIVPAHAIVSYLSPLDINVDGLPPSPPRGVLAALA